MLFHLLVDHLHLHSYSHCLPLVSRVMLNLLSNGLMLDHRHCHYLWIRIGMSDVWNGHSSFQWVISISIDDVYHLNHHHQSVSYHVHHWNLPTHFDHVND